MPLEAQAKTEWAMALLLEDGKTFGCEFGVPNAEDGTTSRLSAVC